LNRIVDILLVQLLRAWLDTAPAPGRPASWLSALTDPVAGPALAVLHTQPGRDWTIPSLAAAAGVSRATLARRFPAHVGCPPPPPVPPPVRLPPTPLPHPLALDPPRPAAPRPRRPRRRHRQIPRLSPRIRLHPRLHARPPHPARPLPHPKPGHPLAHHANRG